MEISKDLRNQLLASLPLSARARFWKLKSKWPTVPGYVFLARATLQIGEAMLPGQWTGAEPQMIELRAFPQQFDFISSAPDRPFANWLLTKYAARPRDLHESFFSMDDVAAVLAAYGLYVQDVTESQHRFKQVQAKVAELCAAGKIVTATRPLVGGKPKPLGPDAWMTERLDARFFLCRLNPADPFGLAPANDDSELIFLEKESLNRWLASSASRGPVKKVSTAEAARAFSEWRNSHSGKPTRQEDEDHMRSLGVSRERTMALRARYENNRRGKRKADPGNTET